MRHCVRLVQDWATKTHTHIQIGVRELGKETDIPEADGSVVATPLRYHHPTCPAKANRDVAPAMQLGGDYGE